ncbi:MAG: FolB domain-containing protein [Proteobacteria bacterium]|nr:FolB domain-containing protein [Pseudomonadota bacterium]
MQTIRIKNLKLRIIVGINPEERIHKQDVLINITADIDNSKAIQTENINDTLNYRNLAKSVIEFVEKSEFYLLDTLVDKVLNLVMSDDMVIRATVEIDKTTVLRYCDSVSLSKSSE